jgi:hypothetical protein
LNPEANMNNTRPASHFLLLSRLLGLSTALVLLAVQATPAAEGGATAPTPAPVPHPVQWGTNLDGKISGEFHDVDFDNIPLGKVVKHLQDLYQDQFDVLIPNSIPASESAAVDPATGLPVSVEAMDARSITVRMRLKNVTAPEVFQAMNMLLEMERTPVRWDLIMFSNRPVAVLRPVEIVEPAPPPAPPSPPGQRTTGQAGPASNPPVQRMVLYIGNLTGDSGSGGMTLDSILKTLTAALEETFSPAHSKLQCHAAAELLIATGTPEEVGFVTEVLGALQQKVSADRERKAQSPAVEPKTDHPRR